MRRPARLPRRLSERFSVAEAAAAGVGRSRRDGADLARPFHGIRSTEKPETFFAVVDCYRPRMRAGHRFGGRTAMRLWGLPHPRPWRPSEPLDILVPPDAAPPRTRGAHGRRLSAQRAGSQILSGVPVVDPVAAFFTCAHELTVGEATQVIDALISSADTYPGLAFVRPATTLGEIRSRMLAWGRFPGCGTVRAALPLAREGVESPKETETRLLLVASGLPEPVVQFEVREDGRLIARVDLAYPELRIAIEYEGDGHRTDRRQWRIDIRRQRELEARGWIVIRLTEADLGTGSDALIASVRQAIARQSR